MPARPAGDGELSEPTDPDPAAPARVLEFSLRPGDAARLLRSPALARQRQGRWRGTPYRVVWHDGPGGELARRGLVLAEQRGRQWRLERLVPNGAADWPPAGPAPVLAEAAEPAALGHPVPHSLIPVAAFAGTQRRLRLDDQTSLARLTVFEGAMRGLAAEQPACRVRFEGEPGRIAALARAVAETVRLEIPASGLAADAAAVARGGTAPARHADAAALRPGPVAAALDAALIPLIDAVLHWARQVPAAPGPEPVHQMRVGVRRLRSILTLFRPVADGAELAALRLRLKSLAARLGAARDWDVFAAGACTELGRVFPADPGLRRLQAAAGRRRRAARQALSAYLAGPEWRALAFDLALLPSLRPWRTDPDPEHAAALAAPIAAFAATALDRRLRHVLAHGEAIDELSPEALHELRKQGKRLRYAAELFTPLFPGRAARRFASRLAALQERLGQLNDGAVAGQLVREIGAPHGHAAGMVQGWIGAGTGRATAKAERAWKKFARADKFWG